MGDEKTLATLGPSALITQFRAEALPLSPLALSAEAERHANAQQELERASRADATKEAYQSNWTVFARWCNARALPALPAASSTVARFVTALTLGEVETIGPGGRVRSTVKKPATIRSILSAINFVHEQSGAPSPVDDEVRRVLDGYQHIVGTAQKRARPLVRASALRVLTRMCAAPMGLKMSRDAAILAIGWAGALREDEIASIRCSDIEVVPQGLLLTLPFRKTDQSGRGTLLRLPAEDSALCPKRAYEQWLRCRMVAHSDALFVSIRGRTAGDALTPVSVGNIITQVCQLLLGEKYTGHSLRSGFITSWIESGGNFSDLMAHTGHKNLGTLSKYARGQEKWIVRPWENR